MTGAEAGAAGPTILAVEDEPLNRRLLHAVLEPAGYRIVDAPSLAAARERLRDETPDLVLLDLRLPDGSGLDLAREIRATEATRSLPVLAATANVIPDVLTEAREAGCDGFLAKPISPGTLLTELRRWLPARAGQ